MNRARRLHESFVHRMDGWRIACPHYSMSRRSVMNWDTVKGQWKQLSGKVKEKWGQLTDDDLTMINGQQDQLVGKLQERYGYTKEKAQKELNDFLSASRM